MIAFFFRRFRWMLVGAVGKELARRVSERQVVEARSDLAERLPDRAVAIADKLPGDILKAAGGAQVAGRMVSSSARMSRSAVELSRSAANTPQQARRRFERMGEEWNTQVEQEDRSLRSRMIAVTRGRTAADDVLLGGRTSWEEEPLPDVADAVERGRPEPGRSRRLVNRVQRSYRPRPKPWD